MSIQHREQNLNRKERAVAKGILKGMDVYRVKQAIMRAERKTPTSDGRTYRVGANASELTCFLLRRDGQGEAGDEIHATARQIEEEVGLTRRQQETARRVMEDEGLLESRVDHRRSDGQRTVFYRLNMWEVARVVVEAELENIEAILKHEGRKTERDRLNKERRKLESAASDLSLDFLDDGGDIARGPGGGVATTCSNGDNKLGQLQHDTHTVTSVDHRSTTDHDASLASRARHVHNIIYRHLQDNGYRLSHTEYGYNLGRLKHMLEHHHPTAAELAALPEACREFVEGWGGLDVADVLADMRYEAARREREAQERGGRQGPQRSRWSRGQDVEEGPTL